MPRTSLSPFARVSSTAEAIRRRNEMEALERAGMQKVARIRVGVCAMDKKVRYTQTIFTCTALDSLVTGLGMHTYTGHSLQAISKPMQAILRRMNLIDEFEIVMFGDEVRSGLPTHSHAVTVLPRTACESPVRPAFTSSTVQSMCTHCLTCARL